MLRIMEQNEELLMKHTIEDMSDGVIAIGFDSRIQAHNRAAAKILGMDDAQLHLLQMTDRIKRLCRRKRLFRSWRIWQSMESLIRSCYQASVRVMPGSGRQQNDRIQNALTCYFGLYTIESGLR